MLKDFSLTNIQVSLRPVDNGYIIDFLEDDAHYEFVTISLDEALKIIREIIYDAEISIQLKHLADTTLNEE